MMHMPYLLPLLLALLLCASASLAAVQTSCPEIEAHLAACRYNQTALLTDLYTTLALPNDPTHCVSASRLAAAYRALVPSLFKQQYGNEYDDHVFVQCDHLSDGRFCPIDVQQTYCTCASVCEMLMVVKTMAASARAYPNWVTQGTPWNPV